MADDEHSISTAPWEQALDTLRAVTNRNEDTSPALMCNGSPDSRATTASVSPP
jgi:hypothetical protein